MQSHQGGLYTKHNFLIETTVRNVDFLAGFLLPRRILSLVLQLACLRDLHLLVLALDALFALSTQGPSFCDALVGVRCGGSASADTDETVPLVIPNLVKYLTFEAQSFGSEGLIRMRVMQVRHFPPPPNWLLLVSPVRFMCIIEK